MKTIFNTFTLEYDPRVRQGQIQAIENYEDENGFRHNSIARSISNLKRWPMELYHAIFAAKSNTETVYKLIASYFTDKAFYEGFIANQKVVGYNKNRVYNEGYSEGREAGIRQADEMIDRLIMDGTLLKVAKRLEGITPEQMALLNKMAGGSSSEKSLVRQLLEI